MEFQIDLNGRKRKELVQVISEVVGEAAVYKGPPGYAYEVGLVTIDRNAVVIFPEDADSEMVNSVLGTLKSQGFGPGFEEDDAELPFQTTIQLPLDGITEKAFENLRLLAASKASLIKKALDVDALPIWKTEEHLNFPWFERNLPPEEMKAYTQFIVSLCEMAKRQTRVLATDKPVENEKYAFRCFLLRLGMIGQEYADTRRMLLRNLTGNGSVKSGDGKAVKEKSNSIAGVTAEPEPPPMLEASAPKNGRFSVKNLFGGLKLMGMK